MAFFRVILLTAGTSWTVPLDFNAGFNLIECIGGGGGGGTVGGKGGYYARISNLALIANVSVAYKIGSAGLISASGGDTYFNGATAAAASVCAPGGASPTAAIGDVVYAGGVAGSFGGAGAGGPNGNGQSVTGDDGGAGDAGLGGAGGTHSTPAGKAGAEWLSRPGGVTAGAGGGGYSNSLVTGLGGNYGGAGSAGAGGAPGLIVISYEPLPAAALLIGI